MTLCPVEQNLHNVRGSKLGNAAGSTRCSDATMSALRFDQTSVILSSNLAATLQPHGTTPFARAWGQGNGLNDLCIVPEVERPVEQVVSAA